MSQPRERSRLAKMGVLPGMPLECYLRHGTGLCIFQESQ